MFRNRDILFKESVSVITIKFGEECKERKINICLKYVYPITKMGSKEYNFEATINITLHLFDTHHIIYRTRIYRVCS